jgi:putative heme-binding domain-containing protein
MPYCRFLCSMKFIKICFLALSVLLWLSGCIKSKLAYNRSFNKYADTTVNVYGQYIPIVLPITKGVKITNPIQAGLGEDGFIYVSNQSGEIFSIRDTDRDGLEDSALFCDVSDQGLRSPSSFVFKNNLLYVGTSEQIRIYQDVDSDGDADTSWVFFDRFPNSKHPYEWTTGLNFGPDGKLYFALSSDSWNAAPSSDSLGFRGALLRVSADGKTAERLAVGLRSPYGIAFNQDGDLFFSDNEGGENPSEELNRWTGDAFFGHNSKKYSSYKTVRGPEHKLSSDVAPAGIEFNSPENDFGGTAGNLFIAFYGPGERWERGSVARVEILKKSNESFSYEEFPVADIPKISDVAFGSDGNLYVTQNGKASYWYEVIPGESNTGRIYKLIFDPNVSPSPIASRLNNKPSAFAPDAIELGKQLYARRACQGCHEIDGKTELIGPNLKDVGNRLSRKEILESITNPSNIIKPSMMALRVYKKDGQTLVGRVVSSNSEKVSLMHVGNTVVDIDRNEIARTENEMKSLMFEGLIKPLKTEEINALLDFIISLKDKNNKF